jgi:hypothetical protein
VVKDAACNLLSLAKIDDSGGKIVIKDGKMFIFPPEADIVSTHDPEIVGVREGDLYAFDADTFFRVGPDANANVSAFKVTTQSP